MGMAAPELEVIAADADAVPPVLLAPPAPPPIGEVGVGTPEVKGTSVALLAPLNATLWVEAMGWGVAMVILGFRTLSIT